MDEALWSGQMVLSTKEIGNTTKFVAKEGSCTLTEIFMKEIGSIPKLTASEFMFLRKELVMKVVG